jgi:hypothetical protein
MKQALEQPATLIGYRRNGNMCNWMPICAKPVVGPGLVGVENGVETARNVHRPGRSASLFFRVRLIFPDRFPWGCARFSPPGCPKKLPVWPRDARGLIISQDFNRWEGDQARVGKGPRWRWDDLRFLEFVHGIQPLLIEIGGR